MQRFETAFRDFFTADGIPQFPAIARSLAPHFRQAPAYDVAESAEGEILVSFAVPGYSADRLSVSVEAGSLKVSGSARKDPEGLAFKAKRIPTGDFSLAFTLADGLEAAEGADLKDGILTLKLKKIARPASGRQIPIASA